MTVPWQRPNPLRHNLSRSRFDAFFSSWMIGAGETFVPAFALTLGASALVAGWMSTGPMLLGALLQLVAPWGVRAVGSHRRWVVGCAGLQALSFVPMVYGAWTGELSIAVLFLATSLYWGFGMATSSAWNTWIEGLVPVRIRARYFAGRGRVAQLGVLAGLLGSGFVLGMAERRDSLLIGFSVIFAIAFLSRIVSAVYLMRHADGTPPGLRGGATTVVGPSAASSVDRHLLIYLLCFQASVFVASPFFTPFMLGPLALDHVEFTVLTASSFVAKAVGLPLLGGFVHRHGARRLLRIAGFGVAPLAALWTLHDHFAYLLALQLIGGLFWAAQELATLLLFFDAIPQSKRTQVLTVFNFANTIAILVGTAIGGALLSAFEPGAKGFLAVFALSTVLRLMSLLLVTRLPDRKVVGPLPVLRTLAVRPTAGAIGRPVLGSLDLEEEEGEEEEEDMAESRHRGVAQ